MSIGTLYTTPAQPQGQRIRAIAAFGGLQIDVAQDYVHNETNRTDAYKAKFASGKIPAFEDKEGFTLFESSAISRYVASLAPNSTLLGSSAHETALIDQWSAYAEHEVMAYAYVSLGLCRGSLTPYNKPIDQTYRDKHTRSIGVLEKHLSTRTFLVGHRITLADITLASILKVSFTYFIDPQARASHPNLVRYFETIVNQPKFKDIFGPIEYAEKALQYVPPPKPAKEAKPAAPPAAKEEKPKAKPKKEEEDDDDEPLVPEEPKAKNPLDALPKSTFNLEDWKRAYSNLDTRGKGGSIEWFYEKFDKEGFSIWRVDFKYNDELTQVFMSSNQIGGFFNRLEASRKYLFGSMGVLGKANDSVISGVFILRGPDAQPVVDVAPDWESYTYKKLDLENDADKAYFEAALAWDLEFDGKAWADGKNFK
ncbi:eEF1-gamma domain-containing protein [Sistotremastrum suecicum HHB10207 ss-3]|uniref:EEF1-gamma domain-containing protein n=1 Tax=Sistotremastrum suecicum HHB10207 ss-3 TaxID=1314776 RepID=A0A166A4P3_9AGAM|nr:eEF1-gamma domain-containing protein [Sistotremastrum suecicum HHB10207 ss-3]